MNHASLFSGIGGFDLAADWMGWNNVLHCDIEEIPSKILQYHYPYSKHYADIRTLQGEPYKGKIDVLTGGFPCQPFSAAGQRRGEEDNRFLWPQMLRVIQEIQPTWVVAENVRGLLTIDNGLVFERIRSEMEECGYECQPLLIPACSVGAPHLRYRLWFIAHANRSGDRHEESRGNGEPQKDAGGHGTQNSTTRQPSGADRSPADCTNEQCKRREQSGGRGGESKAQTGDGDSLTTDTRCEHGQQGNAEGHDRQTCKRGSQAKEFERRGEAWNESWVEAATRLCRVDDGLPRELDGITVPSWRRASLRAYGNAIVPQVAYKIFESIQRTHEGYNL